MILLDVNILVYAEDKSSPLHGSVRQWLDRHILVRTQLMLTWHVLSGFMRIVTNPKAVSRPLAPSAACEALTHWLSLENVIIIHPSPAYWSTLEPLIRQTEATGNLLMDAHLAALAIEHGAALASCDQDFAKFQGLHWINPAP
jgi:uncharacterized protein